MNWVPGSLLNDNHDYNVYSNHYKNHLLNYDSTILHLEEINDYHLPHYFFCRPTLDNKTFNGQLMYRHDLENILRQRRKNQWNTDFYIQISTPKKIYQEYRFWIVNKTISTQSLYRLGSQVMYKEQTNQYIKDFVNEMIDIYCLADAFVMDIALTDDGLKIIECGCINSAGFYDCNLNKLIVDLENYFNQ